MKIHFLITHDGRFHADEVLSTAVLSALHPEAEILRTRDQSLIKRHLGHDAIIYDLGGAYDEDRLIFDHHQIDAPMRQDGSPFSSFGLVWRRFGKDWLRHVKTPDEHMEAIHARLDEAFVRPIDLGDNGALPFSAASSITLPFLIESFNPAFDEDDPEAEKTGFLAAVEQSAVFLANQARLAAADLRARSEVDAAIRAQWGNSVLELPRGMPFNEAVFKAGADHILFTVHPHKGKWYVSGMRKLAGSYALRCDFPKNWAGLEGSDLVRESGVSDAVFCHRGLFLAVAGSREGALTMAEKAMSRTMACAP